MGFGWFLVLSLSADSLRCRALQRWEEKGEKRIKKRGKGGRKREKGRKGKGEKRGEKGKKEREKGEKEKMEK